MVGGDNYDGAPPPPAWQRNALLVCHVKHASFKGAQLKSAVVDALICILGFWHASYVTLPPGAFPAQRAYP
eukprot:2346256-Pleurochrysis_carterae.AAC.3